MDLSPALERFFRRNAPLAPGDRIVVGFSGGPDSTALLLGLRQLARRFPLGVSALHLDHGLDPGSAARAAAALRLAGEIGVPFAAERWAVADLCRPGESLEVAGRRMRYERLAARARELGAHSIATAHHRDDQAETVLLRLLFGSGLAGLAGIRPVALAGVAGVAGVAEVPLVRPLLEVPRSDLLAAIREARLEPADDPTNRDLSVPRNHVRHRLLPALAAAVAADAADPADLADPDLPATLARLATRAAGASRRIAAAVDGALAPRSGPAGVSIPRSAFAELPASLQVFALAALHRRAGAPYPASAAARAELLRQLTSRRRVGCDCGGGWRWEGRRELGAERLTLLAPAADRPGRRPRAAHGGFTYTFTDPAGGIAAVTR
jgi:tRNA(Ile)-lysidine synthase